MAVKGKSSHVRINKKTGATAWTSRIAGGGVKPAGQFLANPHQWKRHPPEQERALVAVLNRVGWVQTVVENARTGYLIDGHMRVQAALSQGEDTPVPYVSVDVSDYEERLMLASMDKITEAALTDDTQYGALLAGLTELPDDLVTLLLKRKEKKKRERRPCRCCLDTCSKGCACHRAQEER